MKFITVNNLGSEDNNKIIEHFFKFGYFNEQLPQCFDSNDLYINFEKIKSFNDKKNPSEPATLTVAKNENARREIKVPNPIHQTKLFNILIDNIVDIKEKIDLGNRTLSNPFIEKDFYEEIMLDIPFKNRRSTFRFNLYKKMNSSMGYRYIYKLDLANFYDSIYTHAIEWAIVGKEVAKNKDGNKANKLGEQLDKGVRNTNSRETSGIPTGPFSSRILSELILISIDEELLQLKTESGIDFEFLHYNDDYEFYFKTELDYLKIISLIKSVFTKYRLKINESKCEFLEYPYHNNIDMKEEYEFYLKKYKDSNDNYQKTDIIVRLFFKADEFYKQGYKGAYKYLYKVIKGYDLSVVWGAVEPFFLGHILIKPDLTKYISEIIFEEEHLNKVSRKFCGELEKNLDTALKFKLDNEANWLLWMIFNLNIKLKSKQILSILDEADNEIFLTFFLSYVEHIGKIRQKRIIEKLNKLKETLIHESIYGPKWILIYQWVKSEWPYYNELKSKVEKNNSFKCLLKNDVSFIKL
ncbi:reverse transcriptase (RNA-dependent DNA polymerase) [Salisediminibacterium halotolerans]|nr:reverse transcriptase (RNA-dependent DNA polymerase) [Actinophytocola xinjiangensis]RPE85505.1 reverse transcriptase (RNA-dependent DNA polymerase) [Salisediminibacterium halotolerans]TWG33460.1 reverse transcriptase (RNA-dependent DNA polymerase) [Salisediminibacterium halotolerans]